MVILVKLDGFAYSEYTLICKVNILVVVHEPEKLMINLSALYILKEDPIIKIEYGVPSKYLRADVGKYDFPQGGKFAYFMLSNSYIKAIVNLN